ncbi:FliH/SctL family protein [Enterococcus italicus]|uniref:FliH/SctL family protein n=1 Tax=Enterococcus italicus TaxID=246144 RepID=UPI0028AC40A8|nr:hypothetical protein [Enterococcus italicus]
MQLLNNNLVKNGYIIQSLDNKKIVTKIEEKKVDKDVVPKNSMNNAEAMQMAINYQVEAQKIDKLRQDTLQQIRQQSKEIEEEAYQKGLLEGQKAGKEEGYKKGIEEAQLKAERYLKIAESNLFDAKQEIKDMIQEQKLRLVQFSIELAEKLTETVIDTDDSVIANKIGNFIDEIDYPQELIIVRVHEKQVVTVRKFIESKKSEWHHARITVLKEIGLASTNYSIDTDKDFTLFDLKKELNTFMAELLKEDMDD